MARAASCTRPRMPFIASLVFRTASAPVMASCIARSETLADSDACSDTRWIEFDISPMTFTAAEMRVACSSFALDILMVLSRTSLDVVLTSSVDRFTLLTSRLSCSAIVLNESAIAPVISSVTSARMVKSPSVRAMMSVSNFKIEFCISSRSSLL